MSDIFISYAREDRDRVELLAEALAAQGWLVWWDRDIPTGKPFDQFIEEVLSKVRCIIVIWSSHSVRSHWVLEEAHYGRTRDILVPVLIDRISLPFGFRRIETADLVAWDGEQTVPAFQKLVNDIISILNTDSAISDNPEEITKPSINKITLYKHYSKFIGKTLKLSIIQICMLSILFLLLGATIGFFAPHTSKERMLNSPEKELSNPQTTTKSTFSSQDDSRQSSNSPNDQVLQIRKTRYPGIIAELNRFKKTGSFIVVVLNLKNTTSQAVEFCFPDGTVYYNIIIEKTRKSLNPSYINGGWGCLFEQHLNWRELKGYSSMSGWLRFAIDNAEGQKYIFDSVFFEEPFEDLSIE
jgi:hypothetical protein